MREEGKGEGVAAMWWCRSLLDIARCLSQLAQASLLVQCTHVVHLHACCAALALFGGALFSQVDVAGKLKVAGSVSLELGCYACMTQAAACLPAFSSAATRWALPASRKTRRRAYSRSWLKGKPGPYSTPPHPAPGAALPAYTSTLLYFSGFFIPWDQIPNYWKWCAVPLQLRPAVLPVESSEISPSAACMPAIAKADPALQA